MPVSPAPSLRFAIVGRPNVGKSSLMNMLASRRVSIVDNTPGTTRDRVSAMVTLTGEDVEKDPVVVELTDTGGFGVYTVEGRRIDDAGKDLAALTDDIEEQIALAVQRADVVLFVIDSQAGVTAQDMEVARLLREGGLGPKSRRRAGKAAKGETTDGDPATDNPEDSRPAPQVVVLANKCDGPRWEAHAAEAAALGFGEPIMVSAENNYRRRELVEKLHALARKRLGRKRKVESAPPAEMQLAIIGKRNAGKSTLVNTLAGEKRVIVSEIAGTTRDAVDVRFEMDGRAFVAIDTAGLRRKKSFKERIEHFALDRCRAAVDRADVALLLIDATEAISQVDQQLGMMVAESYKPVVIVVNKWDLAEGKPIVKGSGAPNSRGRKVTPEDYEQYIRTELKGLSFAPIAFVSAARASNIAETINLAFELFEQSHARATTGKLNRLVRDIVARQGPSDKIGTFAKILYVAQIATAPPTIVCVVNKPDLFTPNYQRFLINRFREELPFGEVPIKLLIRARQRDEAIESDDGTIARVQRKDRAAPAERFDDAAAYFDDDGAMVVGGERAAPGVEPEGLDEPAPASAPASNGRRSGRAERPAPARAPRANPGRPKARSGQDGQRGKGGKRERPDSGGQRDQRGGNDRRGRGGVRARKPGRR